MVCEFAVLVTVITIIVNMLGLQHVVLFTGHLTGFCAREVTSDSGPQLLRSF